MSRDKDRGASAKDRPLMEELEPRLLLSADLPGVPVEAATPSATDVPVTVLAASEAVASEDAAVSGADTAFIARREIVFVDAAVEGYEALVADLTGRSGGGRQVDVFVLDAGRDGIEQISEVLANYAFDVDAVHVLSHGTDAGVQLGDTWLSEETLAKNADAITGWRDALSENADLLFYGCNLAGSSDGLALVDEIANLTGADVAASTDLTGAAVLGGDWDLEHTTGSVEAELAIGAQAQASFAGTLDGTAIWRDSAVTTPQTNTFDDTTFGTESNTASVGNWKIIAGAEAPTRDEKIVVGVDNAGAVTGEIWDGATWSALPFNSLATVTDSFWWGFDVAYESQSGDGMLVWNNGTTGTASISYRVWDGTTWSAESQITAPVAGEASQMRLAASPNSDEMVLVVSNANLDDYAVVWNGSSWGNAQLLNSTPTAASQTDTFVAYEQQSGHAMVVFGKDQTSAYYRTWDGATWSGEGSITAPGGTTGQVRWSTLAADPNSDRIALGVSANSTEVWLSMWDGSSWQAAVTATTSSTGVNHPNVAVAFEGQNSQAIAAYGESGQNSVRYRTWNTTTGWSGQLVGPNVGGVPNSLTLDADPGSNQVMLAVQDAGSDLNFVRWDGEAWGTVSEQETNTTQTKNQPFLFLWDQVTPAPETGLWLSTDKDVAAGGSPGLNAWSDGSALGFGGSDLTFEGAPGGTDGTFHQVFDLDDFAVDVGLGALHYVTADITIAGAPDFDLYAGDVLLVTQTAGTLTSNNSLLVTKQDIVVFRPTTVGDYRSGDFLMLATSPFGGEIRSLSLIERNVNLPDTTLNSGDFLFSTSGGAFHNQIRVWNRSSGGIQVLLDGDDVGMGTFTDSFAGVDLVETDTTLGGVSLTAGTILVNVKKPITIGSNALPTTEYDIVALDVAATTVGTGIGSSSATATMLLQGGDAGFDIADEFIDAFSLTTPNQSNTAPVLTPAAPTFPAITEDDTGNAGQTVATLVGATISDGDAGALEGIAVTGVTATGGTWQYRLGAGAWTDVGAVSATSALLLRDTDSLRFLPDGENGESPDPTLSYRAWDQTTGTAGAKVDPGAGGGATPFSTASDTASVTVSSLNDAPVLVGVSPTLTGITEDDTGNGGDLVSTLLGGVSDVDSGAASGLAITSVTAVNGTWQYRLGAGAWTDVGAVSATSALLLASTDSVRFVPDGDNGGSSSFGFRAWDQTTGVAGTKVDPGIGGTTTAFSTGGDTASITVSSVNDAPVLVGVSPALTGITEDDTGNGGDLVSTLLGGVSDVDSGAASGLAITSVTAVNGTWQYRLGAGAWTDVGAVSATSALLLASTDSVRFVPDGDNGGSSSFDFRAWDQTTGVAGTKLDPGAGGTTTAFSTGSDTAAITVSSLNDAPTLDATGSMVLTTILQGQTNPPGELVSTVIASALGDRIMDVDTGYVEGIAVTAVDDANGTWEYSTNGGSSWTAFGAVADGSAVVLGVTGSDMIRFVPDATFAGTATIGFRAWDTTDANPSGTIAVDTTTNGGTTPFSLVTETAQVTVDPVEVVVWISTKNDVTSSGAPGLANWSEGSAIGFGNPGLAFGEGSTAGTFSPILDLDAFAGDSDAELNALHYVTADITVGTSPNDFDLLAGDVLFTLGANDTLTSTNSLAVTAGDVIVFRPDAVGDYSSGTFIHLLDQPGPNPTSGITLVEQATTVGTDVLLPAGSFLFTQGGNIQRNTIYHFAADNVGPGTTSGLVSTLVTGDDISLGGTGGGGISVVGVDLIETELTIGGVTLEAGSILVTLGAEDGSVGGNGLVTERYDVIELELTSTTMGSGSTAGNARMVLDGSNVGLTNGSEDPVAISLFVANTSSNTAPSIATPGPALAYVENSAPQQIDPTATATDPDGGDLAGGTLRVEFAANGTADDRLGIRNQGVAAGEVGISGSNVTYSGVVVGTFSGGTSGSDALVVLWNSSSSPAAAQAVAQNITFENVSDAPSTLARTVRFQLSDGDGGISNTADQTVNVTAINDAPVLAPAAPAFTALTEDDTGNAGSTIATLLGVSVTDPDGTVAEGIAVTALASGNGTWQYRLGAGAWTDVGVVSATSALLLRDTDSLRFVPDGDNGESPDPTISYRAWDQSTGVAGTKVNPGAGGGTTAFSTASDTASVAVSSVNDAPVLVGVSPTLTGITEDDTGNGGDLVSTLLGGVSDVDSGAASGLAITSVTAVNGTWQYRLGAGAWTDVGAVSATSALLLASTDSVRFVPDGDNGGSSSFDFRAWDQTSGVAGTKVDPGVGGTTTAFSTSSDTAGITVSSVNDAPVLVGVSPTLTGITEDDTGNGGDLVSTLLGGVSDVDSGAASGLAITSVTAVNGTWQYRLGAGAWTDVGAVSATSALLLASTDSVRFVPDGDNGGSSSFDFRAWDQTSGVAGTKVDPGVGGTTTAFSTGSDTAGITVSSVNDAPVLVGVSPTLTGITEDDTGNGGDLVSTLLGGVSDVDSGAASGLAITSVTAVNGTWQYRLGAGAWTDVGAVSATSALLLASTDSVRFVPDGDNGGSSSFGFRAWDQTTGVAGTKVDPGIGGTTTAFSTGGDTASITVTSVNDAPTLDASGDLVLTDVTEDDTGPPGDTVAAILASDGGNPIDDVDTGDPEGIAVTGVDDTNGTWQYRIGAGAWTDVGTVSATSALLLADTDGLRFVPDAEYNGTAGNVSFRGWDQSSGSAGTKVDPGAGGGTSAFSTLGETATLTVTAVNDAPVLVAFAPTLTSVTEDDVANSGQTVASIVGASISDQDGGALEGIAITALSASNGTWQYRVGAGAWTDIAPVTGTSALLLASTDSVRFVPDGMNAGSGTFSYRAWDQTSGSAGTKLDPGVGGGSTAFSTASDTASITTTAVNDAPVLVGVSPTLTGITEDDTGNGGDLVSTLLGGVSDVDTGAASGLAITSVSAVNGTWQYRLGAGAWTDVGAVSATSALLLASTDSVRFVPDGDNGGSSSFDFRAWDQTSGTAGTKVDPGAGGGTTAFSTGSDTAGITVSSVNDAPVLVGVSPTLTGITEDDTGNGGDLVSTLLGGVSDVDTGAASGLAITSVTAVNGTWQYRLGAGAWTDVGAVSATSALLLASTDSVRFVPDGDNGGSSSFGFRAWDQTSGVAGTKVDPGIGGGTTAFSTGGDTASITVSSVNDAPVLVGVGPTLPSITEDDTGNGGVLVSTLVGGVSDVDAGAASGIAVTGLSAINGTWQYRLGAGAWTDIAPVTGTSALLLASTDGVRFVPDGENAGSGTISFRAWDQTTGSAGAKLDPGVGGGTTAFSTGSDTASVSVTAVNDAPVLVGVSPTLPGITEDDTGNGGVLVSTLLGGASDVDAGAASGLAITSLSEVNGTWQYRLGAGAWTDVGAVSATSALLLTSTDSVRFVPDGDDGGSSSFDFRAWDQTSGAAGAKVNPGAGGGTTAFSTGSDTASITVSAVNDAPVLTPGAPSLPDGDEDTTPTFGTSVAALLTGLVTDVDPGSLQGIAITGLSSGNGTWEFQLGGATNPWNPIGVVSDANALLLRSVDRVRFVPDGLNADTASFDFRAWDQSSGVPGTQVNTVPNGGVTAFSTASDTASVTVNAVNDAPVLTAAAPSFTGITEDDTSNPGETVATLLGGSVSDVDNGAVEGIAITGLVSGNGTWQYRVGAGAWIDVGAVSDANALVLQDTDRLRFVPDTLNGTNASVSYRAWDQSSGAAGSKVDASTTGGTTAFSNGTDTASIAVSDVNDQPTMADQGYGVDENSANGTVVGSAIANDVDLPGDTLTWTLLAGNTGGAFLVDPATGEIRVANSAAIDFEANPVFNLTVEVRDPGGLLDTATVTVSLNDVPETVMIPDTPPPVDPPPDPEPPPPEDDPGDEPGDDDVSVAPPVGDGDVPVTETLPPVSAPVPTALRAPVIEFDAETRARHVQREAERLVALDALSLAVLTDDPLVLDAAMWEALNQLGRDFEEIAESDSATTQLLVGAAEGASVAIMAGFLSWFLRGGTLLTSLLTTMPLWSRLDPVPVLDTDDEERERLCSEAEEDEEGDEDLDEERARRVLGEAESVREGGRRPQL